MKASVAAWQMRDLAQKRLIRPAAAVQYLAYRTLDHCGLQIPELLLRAHRYSPSQVGVKHIGKLLTRRQKMVSRLIPDDVSFESACHRTVVLRRPRNGESGLQPGVLLITFTETFRFFLHHVDIERLLEHFTVVLEPSWAGYALPEILGWANLERPILVQATDVEDRRFLRTMDCGLWPVSFGASDWVDHRIFRPLVPGVAKEFDAVYVANYSPGKRVHVFFQALRRIARHDDTFRAALVCSSWGGRRKAVMDLLDYYGVKSKVALFEDLSKSQVNDVLNRSRCNLLLSLKEGSNRSLFEAIFAGIPVILLEQNVGVNHDYVNSNTGKIVPETNLWRAMLEMKSGADHYSPREWAMANISPQQTTAKLGAELDRLFPGDPNRFRNLVVKVNAPEVTYWEEPLAQLQYGISERVIGSFLKGTGIGETEVDQAYWSELEILDQYASDLLSP